MNQASPKVKWLHVITYYVIACAISWPFFWWRDILHWEGFKGPGFLKTASYMWGPGIAGLVCLAIFRKKHVRTISFLGTSWRRSLICWFAPFVPLAILGVKDETGAVSHTLPLAMPLFAVLTILGEEVGWRGFLQDALRPLKPAKRYILIGVLWEIWHFTNRTHGRPVVQAAILVGGFMVFTILLSCIIGLAVERSKSVLIATAIHGWVDLCFEFPGIGTYIAAACALALWIWMLRTWPQQQPVAVPVMENNTHTHGEPDR